MVVDYGKYFPIAEYYEKVVMPLDKRFKVKKKGKFVCCLHHDTDPSLGIIQSKDKGELFHCFGCNAWGNVVDLHKRVSLKYFGKYIDDNRAKIELCQIFGVDIKELPSETNSSESISDKNIRRQLEMKEAIDKFDISDFKYSIVDGKMQGKGVPYFNTLLVRMLKEYKS